MDANAYRLAARIAAPTLASLSARRRWNGTRGPLELDEYLELCDEALDEGLDTAAVAIAAHTTPDELTQELERLKEVA